MSRPVFHDDDMSKIQREQDAREQLQRRPAPTPAGGAGLTYAFANSGSFVDVLSGTTKFFDFDNSSFGFVTNDLGNFSLASDGSNLGLAAANLGTYLLMVSALVQDKSGHRIANPETVSVHLDLVGSAWTVMSTELGDYDASGKLQSVVGPASQWRPTITIPCVVGAGDPLVLRVDQSSGETMRAKVNAYALYLSAATDGI